MPDPPNCQEASVKTDSRVTAINEALLAIRSVKLNAWEQLLMDKIRTQREEEMELIEELGYNKALISTLALASPSLVTLASLAWYTGVEGQTLDAATVFTSIALFENMKDPLGQACT